ncbi:MAG: M23 family metallopeptidase [Microbacteriaceae bacterium]|nr:M23 family metallopeptidase [Microbacteriaceae bacterium]
MASPRTMRRAHRPSAWRAVAAVALSLAIVVGGGTIAQAKPLDEYADWDDVVAAQGDVDRQNELIDEINAQIEQLENDVVIAEANALEKGEAYSEASNEANHQQETHYSLQVQAEEAAETAETAERDAGAMAAAMSNRVGTDPTVELLMQPEAADDFLMSMSTLSKLGSYSGTVFDDAVSSRNNADQLTEQAEVALDELRRLEKIAEDAYIEAVEAQTAVQLARDNAIDKGSELEAMLIPLMEHRDVVQADYEEGERLREEERRRIEEQRRREEEERRRLAEEAAAAQAANNPAPPASSSGGGGGGGGDAGAPAPSSSGISYPMDPAGYVTSWWGYRLHPVGGYYAYHNGLDLVYAYGNSCWMPLYAVTSGTVTYAGEMGTYGNMVDLMGSDGYTKFRYAHMPWGGINVWPGQYVNAGDVIGYIGTTGWSTGCHLHLEIHQGGESVDPQIWLANRGMYYY